MAIGRTTRGRNTSLILDATTDGLNLAVRSLILKSAPIDISIRGTAMDPIEVKLLSKIGGILIPKIQKGKPIRIPLIRGFLKMDLTISLYWILVLEPAKNLRDDMVRIITEYALKRGTAASIIRGIMPASPYIFVTKGIPKMAALPLAAPWAKEPTIVLFLRKILVSM